MRERERERAESKRVREKKERERKREKERERVRERDIQSVMEGDTLSLHLKASTYNGEKKRCFKSLESH